MSPKSPLGCNGAVLVTVMVFLSIALAASALVLGRISSLSRGISHSENMNLEAPPQNVAMARALAVLQTGLPPESPASYALSVPRASGTNDFQVTYERMEGWSWRVTVSPLGSPLPGLPQSFKP